MALAWARSRLTLTWGGFPDSHPILRGQEQHPPVCRLEPVFTDWSASAPSWEPAGAQAPCGGQVLVSTCLLKALSSGRLPRAHSPTEGKEGRRGGKGWAWRPMQTKAHSFWSLLCGLPAPPLTDTQAASDCGGHRPSGFSSCSSLLLMLGPSKVLEVFLLNLI